MAVYFGCHTQTGFGLSMLAYPDGESYLAQPSILLEVFDAIRWAINAEQEANAT